MKAAASFSQREIEKDLRSLGVAEGMIVLLHSSFKEYWKCGGRAQTIIEALPINSHKRLAH